MRWRAFVGCAFALAGFLAGSDARAQSQEAAPLAAFDTLGHHLRLIGGGIFTVHSGVEQRRTVNGVPVLFGTLRDHQLGLGFEYGRRLTPAISFVFGTMLGDNGAYSGAVAYAGFNYRLLGLHPRFIPVLALAVQHQWGFPGNAVDRNTVTGAGVRAGLGFDVALSKRVLVGTHAAFDFGARLLPGVGVLAAFRWYGGPTFLF